ncbi:MAG TPA: tetratricopeptide repeat protein [Stellaceae bacterium]|nr:tetratricopeptide repeat protein [Stellaceae bacterium]
MSDIFREIDEELRRDSLEQLWKHYGKYIMVLAIAIVIATAAVMGWRAYQNKQREAQGVQYAAALDLAHQGKDADAAAAFASLAQKADSGRAVLARLEAAASQVNLGDVPGAIADYDRIAADHSADPAFRDAATMLSARYTLDKGDPQTVIAKLQPLTVATSPWHGLALEMTALAEMKAGENAKARGDFDALAKDATVAPGVRQRAGEMAQTLAP